jgi:hypothetical protein
MSHQSTAIFIKGTEPSATFTQFSSSSILTVPLSPSFS